MFYSINAFVVSEVFFNVFFLIMRNDFVLYSQVIRKICVIVVLLHKDNL